MQQQPPSPAVVEDSVKEEETKKTYVVLKRTLCLVFFRSDSMNQLKGHLCRAPELVVVSLCPFSWKVLLLQWPLLS